MVPHRKTFEHIEGCKEHLSRYSIAVEFRDRKWVREDNVEKTMDFLKSNKVSYVAVDGPQGFESSIPPIAEVTAGYAINRFHGRNQKMWEKKENE